VSFLNKFKITRNENDSRCCCVYINTMGVSIATTSNRFNSGSLPIESLYYAPFKQKPTSELINYLLDQAVKELHLSNVLTTSILSRELYRLILVDFPNNIPKGEEQEASKWLVKDLIDFPVDNLVSDLFILPQFNNNDHKAYVCVAKQHMLKVRQQQIISSTLMLTDMSIIDIALTKLTAHYPENKVNLVVSIMPAHSTLLITMNGNLCLKHDIDCTLNFSSDDTQINNLDALPAQIERFATYFLAQLNGTIDLNIVVIPILSYTDTIVNTLQNTFPYPVSTLNIDGVFSFKENTDKQMINNSLVALGGLINKR